VRGSEFSIDALSIGTSRIFRLIPQVMKVRKMKADSKIKVHESSNTDQSGRQYDPGRFRMFERTLDEYLDRFFASKVGKRDVEKLRELVMYLLEDECESVPKIRRFRSSVTKPRVLDCMFEIMGAIGHRSSQRKSSEEENALYHLIGRIFFAMAYAEKLRSAAR
jgi:hypothetical protein